MTYHVVKGSHGAGLGDLIRAAVVGVAYAGLTDRSISVYWRGGLYNHPVERNLFDDLFTLHGIRTAGVLPQGASVHPPSWRHALDKSFTQLYNEEKTGTWSRQNAIRTYSFDLGRLDYPEEILVSWDFDQFPKLRGHLAARAGVPAALSREQAEGVLLRRHFQLAPAVATLLENAWSKIPRDIPIVGVHVRLTDESIRERGDIALREYWKALDTLKKRYGRIRLFLATDNAAVQDSFRRRYEGMVVYNTKWLGTAGEPLHQNNRSCPDSWANITGAILDMYMLAKCDTLVCPAHSSFSIVSRMVGDIAGERAVTLSFRGSFITRVRKKIRQMLHHDGPAQGRKLS